MQGAGLARELTATQRPVGSAWGEQSKLGCRGLWCFLLQGLLLSAPELPHSTKVK